MPITVSTVLSEPHALEADLKRALPLFASIGWHDSVTSTNQLLMAQARHCSQPTHSSPLGWPRLMGAYHQTAGRGRAARPWTEEEGQALMFSCGFKTGLTLPQLAGLAPALGIASTEVVREHLRAAGASLDVCRTVQMKWPNDLMFGDAKLAGILVESVLRQEQPAIPAPSLYLVVGMGLNLTGHQQLSVRLERAVADLSQAGVAIDLAGLVAALAGVWQSTLKALACDGFTPFVDRIKPIDYLRGKMINVMQQDVVLKSGCAQGLTEQGALALQLTSGVIEPVMVGDVSVRYPSPEVLHEGLGGQP